MATAHVEIRGEAAAAATGEAEVGSERVRTAAVTLPSGKLLGHYDAVRNDPIGLFLRAREAGDVVRVRLGPRTIRILNHPDDVRQVLVTRASRYSKHTRGYEVARLLLRDGLLTSEGELWKRQRRIAQPAFHRRRIDGFARVMGEAARGVAEEWEVAARTEAAVDVSKSMMDLTLRVAGEALLGADVTRHAPEVERALAIVLERFNCLVVHPLPFAERLPTRKNREFAAAIRTLDRIVRELIAERRRRSGGAAGEGEPDDLLAMLMESRDPETGLGMDDELLRDEVLTMLLAGHETTANALSWTFWLLSENPDARARLEDEVDRVLGDRLPSLDDLAALPWTKQVVEESMRLYPPAWILGRSVVEEDEIAGETLPRGSWVYFTAYTIHRDPRFWTDPERFDPARFAPGREADRPRFAYFPFSGGQRQCIGNHFAMLEATIATAVLARRFRTRLAPGHVVRPLPTLTLRPEGGLPMTLERRTPPS